MTTHSLDQSLCHSLVGSELRRHLCAGSRLELAFFVLTTIVNHAVQEASSLPRDIIKMIGVQSAGGGF